MHMSLRNPKQIRDRHLHAQDIPKEIAELRLKGDGEWVHASANILPVKADAQKSKTFVSVRPTEDASEVCAVRIREAEDGEAGNEREYPLREHFPDEDAMKRISIWSDT